MPVKRLRDTCISIICIKKEPVFISGSSVCFMKLIVKEFFYKITFTFLYIYIGELNYYMARF